LKFFFDTCISVRVVRALRHVLETEGGGKVCELQHLSERYSDSSVPDVRWIADLGVEGGWIIISGDPRISRGKAEKLAWKESGLTAFFLSDGWAGGNIYSQTADVIRRWPDIMRTARAHPLRRGFLITKAKEFREVF